MRVSTFPNPPVTLPSRPTGGHKGTFGTVVAVGGCTGTESTGGVRMFGGAALAALAALRAGCGLARLLVPEPLLNAALSVAPVCTGAALAVDEAGGIVAHEAARTLDANSVKAGAIVIGPALGRGEGARALVLRAVGQDSVPVVADADALNLLCETPEFWRDVRAPLILTPHPGEFERLAKALGVTGSATDGAQRASAAAGLAQKLGAVVVLKGDRTVVSDGHDSWTLDAPNPAMSTGGSGDVLAGAIAGLAAQHAGGSSARRLFDLACAGVWAHAAAGKRWRDASGASGGMLATDLLEFLPGAVEGLREGG